MEYDVVAEAEAIFGDHSLQCRYIEFDLSFDPSAISKQCKGPGRHKGWLVISDKTNAAKQAPIIGNSR